MADEESNNSIDSKNEYNIEIYPSETVKINNIQEESNLIQYTENHFIHRLNKDFNTIENNINNYPIHGIFELHENYIRSNSPITISNHGSIDNSNSNSDNDSDENNNTTRYSQLVFYDIEKTLDRYYDDSESNKYSNEIDILTTYMRGQKYIYTHAKYLTQKKLDYLKFPSLFFAALITIIAPFISCSPGGAIFISIANGIIGLCISLMNYLRFESPVAMYLQMANHYDKLETSLELTNSKLLFIENDNDKKMLVLNKIRDIEKRMNEIKETNQYLIPEEIKYIFPVICNINIFSFIKKIERYKKNLIIKFKDMKNEIRYILHKWKKQNLTMNSIKETENLNNIKEKNRLLFLYDMKDKLKTEIVEFRNTYNFIDDVFTKEIHTAEVKKKDWLFYYFSLGKKNSLEYVHGINPILDKYFDFIFVDEK
jgi:hypothetical protein